MTEKPAKTDPRAAARLAAWREQPIHVVVSPFKTATTTVGDALLALGAGSRVMPYRGSMLRNNRAAFERWTRRAREYDDIHAFQAEQSVRVRADLDPLAARLTEFDIFADAPLGHGHLHPAAIKCLAPRARFIWVRRPLEEWLQSVRNWEETHPDTYPNHGVWKTNPDLRVKRAKQMRRQRYKNFRFVAEAFPDDCLEIRIADLQDYAVLAKFCGKLDPGRPLPHANVSKSS